jgi:hemerythrin-like domain-containing protein
MHKTQLNTRRELLGRTAMATAGTLILATSASKAQAGEEGEEIGPTEDLMREHGVLRRIMLIYEEAIRRISENRDLPPTVLADSAAIVRRFVEDYHEKLEEEQVFPRFEKAGKLADLTRILRSQHQAGRRLTDVVLRLATAETLKRTADRSTLLDALRQFLRMYGPHAAREDTVLFPAFHEIVEPREFDALGEEFEKKEDQLFGERGFEKNVDKVAAIEKTLGIYDLAQFTPR